MEGEGNFPEASSIRFLVSSYRWTKPRSAAFPPVSQADQRHEPTHHKAAHLSGQRHNPSCFNSMSQLPPYAQPGGLQTRGANSPRMGNLSRPNHRPTGHGKRPGRSDRRGYDGHSKLDLCPDLFPRPLPRPGNKTFRTILWGGVIYGGGISWLYDLRRSSVGVDAIVRGWDVTRKNVRLWHGWVTG